MREEKSLSLGAEPEKGPDVTQVNPSGVSYVIVLHSYNIFFLIHQYLLEGNLCLLIGSYVLIVVHSAFTWQDYMPIHFIQEIPILYFSCGQDVKL